MPTKCTLLILLVVVISAFIRCNKNPRDHQLIYDPTGHPVSVTVSLKESEKAGLQLGSFKEIQVDKWVNCTGNMIIPRESQIYISAPAAGIVRSLECSTGDYVEAGSVLAGFESPEFIRFQEEFLDAENQIAYYREEYKRQGELAVENATSMKKMQMAQRDYQSYELKLNALRLLLKIYGITADSLKFDQLTSLFLIRAPQSGYVIKINTHTGSYVNLGDELMVMIKDPRLLLRLVVPEQLLSGLAKGQLVDFSPVNDSLTTYQAVLQYMARQIDPISHTSEIYARVSRPNNRLLPGMSVSAKIKAHSGMASYIYTESIVREPNGDYLFVRNQGSYEKVPIKTGETRGDLTEVIDFPMIQKKDSVVVEGSYYLNSWFEEQ